MENIWLTREQAVELIRDRYNTSIGRAKAVLRDAFGSDEVRNTFVNDEAYDEALRLITFDGTAPPAPTVNKADLLDWLNRNPPGRKRAPSKIKTTRRYASESEIPKTVSDYLASTSAPSRDRLEDYVKQLGLNIPRKKLRVEYNKQTGNLGPGRRSNKSAEK